VEMGKEARVRAEVEFSKEKHFERIEQVYETLLYKRQTGFCRFV